MNEPEISEEAQRHHQRYLAALHAMQSAVMFKMNYDAGEIAPKHLRVGVNSAMVENAALVKVLAAKGLITYEEFYQALADQMEAEVETYRLAAEKRYGRKISFA